MAAPADAAAQDPSTARAQQLFSDGLALMRSGKAAEACPKLEESERLDPGMGTEYRLAECYESTGRVASAFVMYGSVAESAKRAGKPDRAEQARTRAEALRARLPTLALVVPAELAGLSGLELRRDGQVVLRSDWGRAIPVDPGEHLLSATAPGKPAWERKLSLEERAVLEVKVPPLTSAPSNAAPAPSARMPHAAASASAAPAPEPPSPAPQHGGLSGQRVAALGVGGAGVLGVIVGAAFGAVASSKWSASKDGHCTAEAVPRCDDEGIQLAHAAAADATASTVGFAVGGAALVGAAVLWFTAPSNKAPDKASRWRPRVELGPGGAGVGVQGRF
jgi:hypothetical protein